MSFLKKLFNTKDEPIRSCDDFWNWFRRHEKSFHKVVKSGGDVVTDFFDKMSPKLAELKDGYWYLTGMCDDHTAELVLTADGNILNIVFVEELAAAAPRIEGWKFTALNPAMDIGNVSIEMDGYGFNADNLHFYSNDDPEYPDEIDITIVHDELTEENRPVITKGVYIFLDNYLGELDAATAIDNLELDHREDAERELIPISRLKAYLTWRQSEFLEKYEGVRHDTANDGHSVLTARLQGGAELIAVINTDVLEWDRKASHPWILRVEIPYVGSADRGMPDDSVSGVLDTLEDRITEQLKDVDGYLYIGRQTAENLREIYFACSEFRKPSKVLFGLQKDYKGRLDFFYNIYKDKYWRSFERFRRRSED